MKKVLVLGRGGAGRSTLAARLGAATGLPLSNSTSSPREVDRFLSQVTRSV
ncbi:hypothetical protein [Amycolatopsis sp. NPDC051102]|uniref:hypothetical protein n=1 Tax=Amycolatopsis sp. NPDC051102 TaxID=3155163 RepID=UPI00341CA0A1